MTSFNDNDPVLSFLDQLQARLAANGLSSEQAAVWGEQLSNCLRHMRGQPKADPAVAPATANLNSDVIAPPPPMPEAEPEPEPATFGEQSNQEENPFVEPSTTEQPQNTEQPTKPLPPPWNSEGSDNATR